ncbi:hypothetical protein [Candidatus Protochlamydia sp. R18]|uniref:hypothetical protein n=1 Tax=Candidatus Protochlamydia sp. R18 TaxID=1353977 RepID=UPI0005AA5CB4|nr:hypothetical protein [Candidatus Protochlamydia sp. R18]
MNKIFDAVYYVESSDLGKAYNPVAIKPKFFSYKTRNYSEQRCEWLDTDRGAYFYYETANFIDEDSEKVPPRQFKLIGENEEEITFTYLTTKLFKEKVADKVGGSLKFSQDSELQNYYLEKFSKKMHEE